jgi:hypothetical protein
MMRPLLAVAAAVSAALCLGGAASAQTFTATLNGAQERPTPVATPATGTGIVTLLANSISVNLSVTGLTTPVTVFHIHRGGPEEVGPVVLDLETATGIGSITTGFDAATNSYSLLINKTYTDTGTAVSITDLINGFKAGNPYYFNVHTTNFPGGEVRGNLAIPEPGTLALVAGASLPLLGLARRRRRLPEA